MTDEDEERDSRTSAVKFVDELSKECIMWLPFFFFFKDVVRFNRILIEF